MKTCLLRCILAAIIAAILTQAGFAAYAVYQDSKHAIIKRMV